MSRPFRRRRDGTVRVVLRPEEASLLGRLASELRELLETPDGDLPAVQRLFPRAYLDPTEEEAERTWAALAHPDLLRGRLDALDALVAECDPAGLRVDLDEEGQARWLGVLNDARLVLGSALGVTDDGADPEPTDALAVYQWLTALQGELVEELLAGLPETGADDPLIPPIPDEDV